MYTNNYFNLNVAFIVQCMHEKFYLWLKINNYIYKLKSIKLK